MGEARTRSSSSDEESSASVSRSSDSGSDSEVTQSSSYDSSATQAQDRATIFVPESFGLPQVALLRWTLASALVSPLGVADSLEDPWPAALIGLPMTESVEVAASLLVALGERVFGVSALPPSHVDAVTQILALAPVLADVRRAPPLLGQLVRADEPERELLAPGFCSALMVEAVVAAVVTADAGEMLPTCVHCYTGAAANPMTYPLTTTLSGNTLPPRLTLELVNTDAFPNAPDKVVVSGPNAVLGRSDKRCHAWLKSNTLMVADSSEPLDPDEVIVVSVHAPRVSAVHVALVYHVPINAYVLQPADLGANDTLLNDVSLAAAVEGGATAKELARAFAIRLHDHIELDHGGPLYRVVALRGVGAPPCGSYPLSPAVAVLEATNAAVLEPLVAALSPRLAAFRDLRLDPELDTLQPTTAVAWTLFETSVAANAVSAAHAVFVGYGLDSDAPRALAIVLERLVVDDHALVSLVLRHCSGSCLTSSSVTGPAQRGLSTVVSLLLDAGVSSEAALAPEMASTLAPNILALLRAPTSLDLAGTDLETDGEVANAIEASGGMLARLKSVDLSGNSLEALPMGVLERCMALTTLNLASSGVSDLALVGPFGPGVLANLTSLNVASNGLYGVPMALLECATALCELDLSGNELPGFPDAAAELLAPSLVSLALADNNLNTLPPALGSLTRLRYLNVAGHAAVSSLEWLSSLTELEILILDGAPLAAPVSGVLDRSEWMEMVRAKPYAVWLDSQVAMAAFDALDEDGVGSLDAPAVLRLNAELAHVLVPRKLDVTPIAQLSSLRQLSIKHLGLDELSRELLSGLGSGGQLTRLDVSSNALVRLPEELGTMSSLVHFECMGNPLEFPAPCIRAKGSAAILLYYQALAGGSVPISRTKLCVVGLGNAGKTSLIAALTQGPDAFDRESKSTDGIAIREWVVPAADVVAAAPEAVLETDSIRFSVWDFAGQSVYYNTHQFFLSHRAIYVLVWNIRLGAEHGGLDFWLNSIRSHHPEAPVVIVGTHADQVPVSNIEEARLRRQFSQIRGFVNVSSATGLNIDVLRAKVLAIAAGEPYMNQIVPTAFIKLENQLRQLATECTTELITQWSRVRCFGALCTLHTEEEVLRATEYLTDLGTIIHVQTPALRDLVILSPQFLADVMACVVSAQLPQMDAAGQAPAIVDGILYESATALVWARYDTSLHTKLLHLIAQFELVYALPPHPTRGPRYLVPCLLPDDPVAWPAEWRGIPHGAERVSLTYSFDFLPIGLFSRIQVRARDVPGPASGANFAVMWRTGLRLRRGPHVAELTTSQKRGVITVAVAGSAPHTLLSLFSQIISRLVDELYTGLAYSVHVPCPECTELVDGGRGQTLVRGFHVDGDESLRRAASSFLVRTIRRAVTSEVPFLQCEYFHMVPVRRLVAYIPPRSDVQVADQFERDVAMLEQQHVLLTSAIYISYSFANSSEAVAAGIVPAARGSFDPLALGEQLRALGFTVYFRDPRAPSGDDMSRILQSVRIFVACVSVEYFNDPAAVREYEYAIKILHKSRVPVVVGESFDFMRHRAYMLISGELWIDFVSPATREAKLAELSSRLLMMLPANSPAQAYVPTDDKGAEGHIEVYERGLAVPRRVPPLAVNSARPVFVSYAWRNSAHAFGEAAVGKVDPRGIAIDLAKNYGLGTWLDIDCLGRNGLFEDIAAGLSRARVVVACVSDAYAASDNCRMEFLHAAKNLCLPMVVAVVGSGDYAWTRSEVGLIAAGLPQIKFGSASEFEASMEELAGAVCEAMASSGGCDDEPKADDGSRAEADAADAEWADLREHAQRSFMRQLNMADGLVAHIDGPRIFAVTQLSSSSCCVVNGASLVALCENPQGWHMPLAPEAVKLSAENGCDVVAAVPYFDSLVRLMRLTSPELEMVQSVEFAEFIARKGSVGRHELGVDGGRGGGPLAGGRSRTRSRAGSLRRNRASSRVSDGHVSSDQAAGVGGRSDGEPLTIREAYRVLSEVFDGHGGLELVALTTGESLWLCRECAARLAVDGSQSV
ncbi:leucine-rich-repeat protein [Thecamonas trahens ATCC 50062]|uniref:non-specific serine/threonine protein kinase n=1 Tax=Thecamonas trahens ATCC 50062 TaxID=461836 RepID=A0A0L0DH63_THETB|nr:leucine-rich-repeat protein [Thecamonas trahens ATCC 50062]KNC51476.1 leucine-rich-repeat protein [Thecamonas trahens ATCC 50062]|eukprot:XP_013756137.1 leucine-rich-repeat protein [Thecamonas trahens ATCC 50062]